MPEIFSIALSGVNIIPTIILSVTLVYWLLVIIGGLDIDIFGFDIDFDADADGFFVDLFSFLKINNVPITIYFTIVFLIMWSSSMLLTLFTGIDSGLIGISVLIGSLPVALIITSYITLPFKGLFKDIGGKGPENSVNLKGQLCTLKYDLSDGEISQAEVDDIDNYILISVKKHHKSKDIKRGEQAVIIKQDESKDFYFIELYNENEWE